MKTKTQLELMIELVWEHGDKVDRRDDYAALLKAVNIKPKEARTLLPEARKKARTRLKKSVREVPPTITEPRNPGLFWLPEMKQNDSGVTIHHEWFTQRDEQYKVVAGRDKYGEDHYFGACFLKRTKQHDGEFHTGWYPCQAKNIRGFEPVRYHSLREALEACMKHYRGQGEGRESHENNPEIVLSVARKLGLDEMFSDVRNSSTMHKLLTKVEREVATKTSKVSKDKQQLDTVNAIHVKLQKGEKLTLEDRKAFVAAALDTVPQDVAVAIFDSLYPLDEYPEVWSDMVDKILAYKLPVAEPSKKRKEK